METGKHYYEKLEPTEYGQTLVNNVRWGSFKPVWMENKHWEHILGDDVNNYRHMGYTALLAEQYVERTRGWGYEMSEEDGQKLIDCAYIHDFPEAIDGDVPDPDKKFDKKTFAREKASMIKVLGSICTQNEAKEVAARVIPIMQGRSLLSHHFRAIEVIGYTETTKRANEQLYNMPRLITDLFLGPGKADLLHCVLEDMATKVHAQNLDKLRQFKFLPAVSEYLLDSEKRYV